MHKGINTTCDEGQTPIPVFVPDVADPITANEQGTYAHEGKNNFRTRNVVTRSYGFKPGQDMAVRRLTPVECERLQGFPDNYTNIPGASDSGRYKALGNSMAVPVMAWIGRRIGAVHER
jgi:site-specific DNA-cytosine methylase